VESFAQTFYDQVKKCIDTNQLVSSDFESLSANDRVLVQEVLEHAYFCNETSGKFHGRQDLLIQVDFLEFIRGKIVFI